MVYGLIGVALYRTEIVQPRNAHIIFVMKILVISGFLGAGKTTFIQALSAKTGKAFAVMENEYGQAGIDGDVLQSDRLKVWELTEGCICCSLKSDFASSILTIANTLDPEYLIVEPTGVGLLSSVMHNIKKIEYDRITLLEPITIADVHCVENYLQEFAEIYADQIKNAPRILLSKIEHTSPTEISRITAMLRGLNPQAEILTESYQNQPESWWLSLLKNSYTDTAQPPIPLENEQLPDLETVHFTDVKVESVYQLLELLVALLRGFFGAVYRAKGFAVISGQWTKFDIVNKQYTIATCEPMSQSKAVIIGQNLDKRRLQEAFTAPSS